MELKLKLEKSSDGSINDILYCGDYKLKHITLLSHIDRLNKGLEYIIGISFLSYKDYSFNALEVHRVYTTDQVLLL